jgi:hypothetical protein
MRTVKIKVLFALACLGMLSCDKDDEVPSRSFRMGFTPFPYEISETAANYVYGKLASEADIVNHHFDNGVPWVESLTGAEFSSNIMNDWNFRKSKTSTHHKVYLSVTPINALRTGLASYRGDTDNMELPEPWNTYRFNSAEVKSAYLNYCKRAIEFFQPSYFGMSIEANLLYFQKPEVWTEYLELHQFIYTELKKLYPALPVFTSVVGAQLLKDFIDGNDHVTQRLAALQILEYSDYYALSFYPYMSKHLGNPYPENTFEELFNISAKPLVVAETGYVAQTFSLDTGTGLTTVESDQVKQQKFFNDLLKACERRNAEFVIDFVIRDYDQLWTQIGSPTDISIAWRDCGLYDENGESRLAHKTWKEYFARELQIRQ